MKKCLSILILFAILVSSTTYSLAEDNFTVKNSVIKVNEELCNIDIVVPYFEGFKNSDTINGQIRNIVADSIGDVKTSAANLKRYNEEAIKNGEEPSLSTITLNINYDYEKSGNILSVQLNTYVYLGGAHGTSLVTSITANTETGQIYAFKDLFKDDITSSKRITFEIIDIIDKYPEGYFDNYEQTIIDKNGDFEFYINGDKLVVYFGHYDIAPFAAGINRFVFDSKTLKDLLKNEVYNSIKDGQDRGFISYNGTDIHSKHKVLNEDTLMIPLRDIAEALGYKVDWNKNDGAIVAGGFIKNGVVIDGVTFVPLQYFTQILEENVSLGSMNYTYPSNSSINFNEKILVRAFSKDGYENNFDTLITKFESPITGVEAINMYAEAVKTRNGAVQYGLFSEQLRKEKYEEFKELSFVTGTSSPWVDSYEVTKTGDKEYQISFNLKTSVPTDSLTTIVDLKVIEYAQYWRIESIKEFSN